LGTGGGPPQSGLNQPCGELWACLPSPVVLTLRSLLNLWSNPPTSASCPWVLVECQRNAAARRTLHTQALCPLCPQGSVWQACLRSWSLNAPSHLPFGSCLVAACKTTTIQWHTVAYPGPTRGQEGTNNGHSTSLDQRSLIAANAGPSRVPLSLLMSCPGQSQRRKVVLALRLHWLRIPWDTEEQDE